ncbi:MAG: GWxTD domain-containing protein [Bacteroidetes bacterium]|nr:GWxTD domain-containing protein [Bacteroidota bacterium]
MKYSLTLLLIAALPLTSLLQAQTLDDELQVRVVSIKGDTNAGHLDVYTEIPYTSLQFETSPSGFIARYNVEAEISRLDSRGRPQSVTASPIWEQTVTVQMHANTVAEEASDLSTHSVALAPGRYLLSITLTDLTSSKTFFQEITAEQRDFSQAIALSDVVLLAGYDPERRSIVPRISPDVSAGDLQAYYEVYTLNAQTLLVTQELIQQDGTLRFGRPHRWSDTLSVGAGRHQQITRIPASDLEFGQYNLVVTLRSLDGGLLDRASHTLSVRWDGINTYLNNLEEAIEQLTYIARNRELREFRRAETQSERKSLFDSFWKKRDPTPGTLRNEAMEEHYYRVDYANQNFGQQISGWQSDRGHVFILHGHPDEVEHQTFSYNNKPWEVWYFFRIGRQYMFVDETGFGDYELVLPVWDERTRLD